MVQGTEEWRIARLGKPSASRLDDILAQGKGGAPSTTREDYLYELACERLTGIPYENFHSRRMDDGTENEPLARSAYEVRCGVMVEEHPGMEAPCLPGFWSSPDGLVGADGGLEIKCPLTKKHIKTITTGRVDRKYILQMAGNVVTFERDWWDFGSYDPSLPSNLSLFILRFPRSALPVDEVVSGVKMFLQELDALVLKLQGMKIQPIEKVKAIIA